jgi:hypothetical protein
MEYLGVLPKSCLAKSIQVQNREFKKMLMCLVEYALELVTTRGTNGVLLIAGMSEEMSMNLLSVYKRRGTSEQYDIALRPVKGKPLERVGRKATGLRPASAGYGSRVAGHPQHLWRGCLSCTAILEASHWISRGTTHLDC